MDRHGSFGLRLALASLVGCLALGAVWIAEHTADFRSALSDDCETGTVGTRPVGGDPSIARLDSTASQPRLFLARDRVRRLPAVHESEACFASASLPGEGATATSSGPMLFTPENGPSVPVARRSVTAALPIIDPKPRAVLAAPEINFGDAMPECAKLDNTSVLPLAPPVPAPPVEATSPMFPAPADTPPAGHDRTSPALVDTTATGVETDLASDSKGSPPKKAATDRAEQLEQIAREADRHTRRGFELAGRNAVFAARSQFVIALRLLAQGLDTEHGSGLHSRALADGLDAISEADDFIPRGARVEANLDLAMLVRGHRTPVLKQAEIGSLTPMQALKAYFTYAQERLAVAAATEVAGSMALHGLGKLHAAVARNPAIDLAAPEPKAVAFFQAALLVYPRNVMAANDLGVLLARSGHWDGARQVLEHAVATNPQSVSWQNLGKVYRQLGNTSRARHAQQMVEALSRQALAQMGTNHGSGKVQWLAPGAFAGTHVDSRVDPAPRTGQASSGFPRSDRR